MPAGCRPVRAMAPAVASRYDDPIRPQSRDRVMATPSLPLDGFTVIDLTAHRAGPTAVRQLADWGADVIKIEMPGERTDATGSRRDGPDFQNLHRNKRSLSLDLKTPEGKK